MRRIVYDKQSILIPVGSPSFSKIKNLRYNGTCIGVKVIHISEATAVSHEINISVDKSSGALVGATDFRDSIAKGGNYEGGFKPCNFNSREEITVNAMATENISGADFKAQLIFMIEEDCNQ